MKTRILVASLVMLGLLAVQGPAYALSWQIEDDYIGGDDHGRGDVIYPEGEQELFEVEWMDVDVTKNWMTVNVRTDFGAGETYGTDYGDLFISTDGWQPDGDAPYLTDTAATGEVWEYVFDVSSGNLYNISEQAIQENNILLSDDVMDANGAFRNGQEVLIDAEGLDDYIASSGGSAGRDGDYYAMSFDISELGLDANNFKAGLHWTMTCGNDVIEGLIDPASAGVPEPSTVLLLGLGVIGVFVVGRRKASK
jgi:hypothetical protein